MSKRVCLIPKLSGVGGPATFQQKLSFGLSQRGVEVCYDIRDIPCDALLVVGGTRHLVGLWQARRRGTPIIQRLNGMNWLHRVRRTGVRHYLRAEYGNSVLRLIRDRLADRVVYQSQFAAQWWQSAFGAAPVPEQVIYNGVDLEVFSPRAFPQRSENRYRLLMVEGNLGGGYELGLETAIRLTEELVYGRGKSVELIVVGKVHSAFQEVWKRHSQIPLFFTGPVPHARIPELDRSAHLLYSADIQAACPNAVIEALACGLPVVAFDTGALPELVQGDAGRIVPYGGDAWRLDPPNIPALACGAIEILEDQDRFRIAARACA